MLVKEQSKENQQLSYMAKTKSSAANKSNGKAADKKKYR